MILKIARQFNMFLDQYYWKSAILVARCAVARQYRNSYLGAIWLLLPSIVMMGIYAIIMPMIMKSDAKSYLLYLLATLPLWQFMSNSLASSTFALIANGETLKRCIISSSIFPVADVLKNTYSYIVGFSCMMAIALVFNLGLSWHILLLPIYFIPVLLTVMCMCVGIAYISPYVQDIRDAITIAMNMLIWASAVIYPISVLPETAQKFIEWNPLYILLQPTINLVHDHQIPDLLTTIKLLAVMLIALVIGYTLHKIGRRNFVYYI